MGKRAFAPLSVLALAATLVVADPAGASSHFCNGQEATVVGTPGADTLRGTEQADVIVGLGGNDIIRGLGGNDIICGDGGNDTIYGDAGNDRILGGDGNDRIRGGVGADIVDAGHGADVIWGGANRDILRGRSGNDSIHGGHGNDRIFGNVGNDRITGGPGANFVHGGGGFDTIDGSIDAADVPESGEVPLAIFEALISDEMFRLVNCARTGDYTRWCEPGDENGWNVSAAERTDGQGNALTAYARSTRLDNQSREWSRTMRATDVFEHGPDAGWENIAFNFTIPNQTAQNATQVAELLMGQWMDSAGHRRTIMHPTLDLFGSGTVLNDSAEFAGRHQVWGTQRFEWN